MNLTVVIASFGDDHWLELARRARASAEPQADEVVIEHWEHGPIEAVRNVAADKTSGEWLCFLDADDELMPGFVDAIRKAPGRGLNRLLTPAVEYVFPTGPKKPVIPNKHHPMPPLNHCVVGTVVSRQMFEQAGGFDPSFWPWSDYELWLRCCRHGARVVEVPRAVYRVHVNPGSDNLTLTVRDGQALGTRIHDEHRLRGGEFPVKGGERG